MPRARADAVNAETVTTTIFGVDPWGAHQGDAIAALSQRPQTGRGTAALNLNPVGQYRGNAVVPVQEFLGEGQLSANLGGAASNNNPTRTFHSSTSAAIGDPVMAALADQLARGLT